MGVGRVLFRDAPWSGSLKRLVGSTLLYLLEQLEPRPTQIPTATTPGFWVDSQLQQYGIVRAVKSSTSRRKGTMKTCKRRGLVFKFVLGAVATGAAYCLSATLATATNYYWDKNSTTTGAADTPTGTWGSDAYWNNSSTGGSGSFITTPGSGDNLYFVAGPAANSGENAYIVTVAGSQNANRLFFQSSGAPSLPGNGAINLWGSGGDAINMPQYAYGTTAQGAVAISVPIVLQASQTWTNNSSNSLTIAGNVINGANTLTVGGSGGVIISDIVGNGTGGLVKTGTGTLMLQAANSYTGGTSISGGTLNLANGGALQGSTVTSPTTGIVFDQSVASRIFAFGGLSGSGSLNLQNNAASPAGVTLTVGGNNGSTTYSGTLSSSGSLTKVGTGTLTLTGSSTYTGATAISAGILAAASTGTLPGYASTGRVTAASSGTLALSAGSSWTAANINGLVTANGTGFASGSTLGIDTTSGNFSYGYSIAGSMGLTKLGSNVLTLSSSSTYTGLTTITSGTLTISNSSALSGSTVVAPTPGNLTFATNVYDFTFGGLSGSQNLSLQNNGAVALTVGANNASTTYAGALIGSGSLTKTGSGMLTLIGSSTYSGVTTISSGTLRFGDGISGHDGSLVATGGISNNAALVYNLNGSQTYAGIISGTGTLTKTGSGTLVLTNANTFSGGTTISAGTLQLGNGTSGNDGSLSNTGGINDNATLVFNLYGPKTYSGTISGLGNMTKAGNGTLTLSGSSTFSGTTTVSGGTLKLSNANALQASTVTPTTGSLSFDTGIASFTFGGLGGSGNISLWNTASSPIALTVGGNNTSTTYSGVLSGSGGSLTKMGVGTLTLTGSNSFSGGITVGAGTMALASSGSLTSATSKNLYVGNSIPAAMTIQDTASVNVGGELDVNYGATTGSPSTLTITSASTSALTVAGATIIGRASMNADPTSMSAAVYQSNGGATLNGLATIGNAGTATSLYDIDGGTLGRKRRPSSRLPRQRIAECSRRGRP